MKTCVWAAFLLLGLVSPVFAQRVSAPASDRKQARAVRVQGGAIDVDGRLTESAWETAPRVQDFVQKEPTEGAQPTENTEVRFLYDDRGLYIGARMSKLSGATIQAPMGRRDRAEQSEHLLVALDTFLDRRTAYVFGVTASGVRIDRYHAKDDETAYDETFDPVWEAKTTMDAGGWTAEFWIPFSQLRFNAQPELVWGLNIHRYTPTLNEDDYWVLVPRTVTAWSSRFGSLSGIQRSGSNQRIELLPYVAGSSTVTGNRNAANPFDTARNLQSRTGADVKIGVGPNLTLDATFNPDFGQVEADPAEVNLSAFETNFAEKRPFFLEGASLLNLTAKSSFFYSRRIGARPTGPAAGTFVDYPDTSTILTAAKLTGRLPSGTSIGVLAAVTDREVARVFDPTSSQTTKVAVTPRTEYGVMRLQQQFGANNSTVNGMATLVRRNFSPGDPLSALQVRNAFALASDATLRFRGGEYELVPFAAGTLLQGAAQAVARVQRSSAHYAQRPDRRYDLYDPTLTSLSGSWFGGTFSRIGGRHWIWNVFNEFQSPNVESNDVGRMNSADAIGLSGDLRWRETTPGKKLRSYWYGVKQNNEWNFGHVQQTKALAFYTTQTWKNFWVSQATYTDNFRRQDPRLTRGGPTMGLPAGWTLDLQLRNRTSAQTTWSVDVFTGGTEFGEINDRFTGHLAVRPGPRWQLSVDPTLQRQVDTRQYISTLENGRPETFGRRYVFGTVDRSTYSTQFRLNFTVRPDLNLDLYAEPFAASGRYWNVGELLAAGSRQLLAYGSNGTTATKQSDGRLLVTDGASTFVIGNNDFNVHSFRSNVVVRWEYRPGSTLYLVWQQDRHLSEVISDRVSLVDPFHSLTVPGNNYFVIKTSFWIPVR